MSDKQLESIRRSNAKNRANSEYVEMRFENSFNLDDRYSIDKILKDYLINLNVLLFWRKRHVDLNYALKNLAYRTKKDLSEKLGELSLFLTQYFQKSLDVDIKYPYLESLSLKGSNYEFRSEAILDLRKQSVIELKNILEVK